MAEAQYKYVDEKEGFYQFYHYSACRLLRLLVHLESFGQGYKVCSPNRRKIQIDRSLP